jgi:hypothetical protein
MSFFNFFKKKPAPVLKSKPRHWFEALFGFRENIENVKSFIECEEKKDGIYISSKANNKRFNAGIFKIVSVSDFNDLEPRGNGTFNVLSGNGKPSRNPDLINALPAQSIEDNDGATYQAASKFSCLEFTSPKQTASEGITNLKCDFTHDSYSVLVRESPVFYCNYFVPIKSVKSTLESIYG